MKLLLKDAKPHVAEVLNMSPTDSRVVDHINEAIQYVIQATDWTNTLRTMTFSAKNGILTLPNHVVQPIKFTAEKKIGQVYGKHYEYISNGPGPAEDWDLTEENLVDIGESPTTFDISTKAPNVKLSLTRPTGDTASYEVRICGTDATGNEIYDAGDGARGVKYTLTSGSVSNPTSEQVNFVTITQVIKPITKGYLTVTGHKYGDNSVTEEQLSVYKPSETNPSYRRFKIYGKPCMDENKLTTIKGVFRIGYAPVYEDNDELLINLITPLKLMARAIKHLHHDEIKAAATLQGLAERILRNEVNRYDVADNLLDIDIDYGNGDIVGV
jgi:hypothetical protein|tara:strand:+ start:1435 stop:2415 length:981 start_codon:yes stop_codon:yes gene_type:complete